MNRIKDLNFFYDDIEKYQNKKRLVLLSSPKGWGKTFLMNKVSFELQDKKELICCDIPNNLNNIKNDGNYIKEIALSIDLSKKEFKNGLEYFFNNYNQVDSLLEAGFKDLVSNLDKVKHTAEFLSSTISKDTLVVDKLLNNDAPEITILAQQYIQKSITKNKLALFIENIHYIDLQSLEFLRYLLKTTGSFYIILEYNNNSNNSRSIELLKEYFNLKENNFIKYEMEIFPRTELSKILYNNSNLLESFIQNMYEQTNGDLTFLDVIENDIDKPLNNNIQKTDIETLYLNNMSKLNSNEKYILTLIIIHPNSADIDDLKNELLFHSSFSSNCKNIQLTIDKLISMGLLYQKRSKFFASNSNISNIILSNNNFLTHRLIANQKWKEFYIKEWEFNNFFRARSETLYNLLYFSAHSSDIERIDFVLDELNKNLGSNFIKFLYLLEEIKEKLSSDDILTEKLYLVLIKTYYTLERIEESFNLLGKLNKQSNKFIAYTAILLYRQGKLNESIDFCDKQKNKTLNLELFLINVKIICYRNLNQVQKAKKLFEKVIKNKRYKDLYEYGYILRNAQMLFKLVDAIPYVEESINHFEINGDKKQLGLSKITLSTLKARSGAFDESISLLNDSLNHFKNIFTAKHTVYNNLTVLKILKNEYDEQSKEFIKKAILTIDEKTPFAYIITLCNNLIINIEQMNLDICDEIITSLISTLKTTTMKDAETLRMVYFNISVYFKNIGSNDLSNEYIMKLKDLKPLPLFWENKISKKSNIEIESDDSIMLKHKYRPIFLTHWFIDVHENL